MIEAMIESAMRSAELAEETGYACARLGKYGELVPSPATQTNRIHLYLLSRRLPKEEFIATGAWFFFLINLTKMPIYAWHGLFSRQSLIFVTPRAG